jgi:hypothetical protein
MAGTQGTLSTTLTITASGWNKVSVSVERE